jgi:hypothetical protein
MFLYKNSFFIVMRGQGALEYLIIIAAVLAISAIVVLFITGAFRGSSGSGDMSKCKLAAANCQRDAALGVGQTCNACSDACRGSSGKEVIPGAIPCCKAGASNKIYTNSTACAGTGELFYDEFLSMGSWQKFVPGGGYDSGASWYVDTTEGNNSNNVVMLVNGSVGASPCSTGPNTCSGAVAIKHAESTVGYNNIQLTWYQRLAIPNPGLAFTVLWSSDGGANWNTAYNVNNLNELIWSYHSVGPLPAAANNNPNFVVSLYCYSWGTGVNCKVDSFRVIGTTMP